jgi:hypothetical protein
MEIIVDAYGPEEQALGWYYYLKDMLSFPFTASYIDERTISPLRIGKKVKVLEMAPEDECLHEMFVKTSWRKRMISISLAQLKPVDAANPETKEAIADWQYWVTQGYEL